MELKEAYASKAGTKIDAATNVKEDGPLQFVVDIVPSNFLSAASDNSNMLQVIFFAIWSAWIPKINLLPKSLLGIKTAFLRFCVFGAHAFPAQNCLFRPHAADAYKTN